MKDCVARTIPYWHDHIAPDVIAGKRVVVAAHGNSLRAICMHLDKLSEDEVLKLNIPTALPFAYELDEKMNPIKKYYLATDDEVKSKVHAVASQGKAK